MIRLEKIESNNSRSEKSQNATKLQNLDSIKDKK